MLCSESQTMVIEEVPLLDGNTAGRSARRLGAVMSRSDSSSMTCAEKMKDRAKDALVAGKMIFLFSCSLPAFLSGCATSPARRTAASVEQSAALARPWRDGSLRYCYPGSDQVMAEGRFSKGSHAGCWVFRYRDGSPFARGEFDPTGQRTGPWLLWTPDGEVSRERSTTKCDSGTGYGGLYLSLAGAADFEWDSFPEVQRKPVEALLKLDGPKWSGTGLYAEGFWQRELHAEELKLALEAAHMG